MSNVCVTIFMYVVYVVGHLGDCLINREFD